MKVLVSGGAGFIGHNTAIFLKHLGYEVLVFDNLERATALALKKLSNHGIPVLKGSILNVKAFDAAIKGVDVVVHAAAYINVEESVKKPALYFKNNILGTANVAKACLDRSVELLIYISSAAVYGEPKTLPISENYPADPISPYGLTKLMGERTVEFYSKKGLKAVTLRLFNVYGPGQSSAYAGVITRFIENISKGLPPIIYGDGEQTRDFIHVEDVAEAIRLAMEKNAANETFNIASGKPTKIKALANLAIELAGLKLKPIYAEPRVGDIKHSLADIAKAQRILGFKPKTSLEEGLKNLIQTMKRKTEET
ncbi:NAD-dependent epimerase/dehydratase family protein [Candidatus Bathyarchaeota archaeon]|nr:NAD-dependent epimerase/dehydratase family protein [Candidatus Bathyarchaeota archaeon]